MNYLEIIKDRLYNPKTKQEKESAQYVLYTSLLTVLKLFAPIMPYITEELYQAYFQKHEKEKSIHISSCPKYDSRLINKKLKIGFGLKILNPEDTSYTISARYYKDGAEALIKYSENEIRRLTLQEIAIIQSFPKTYKFEEGIIKTYKQIGNAVPPKLALNVAKAIKKEL